jgi:hypothetical protein
VVTTKMKIMDGDLLVFNTFTVDVVPVQLETEYANECFGSIITRWGATRNTIAITVNELQYYVDV